MRPYLPLVAIAALLASCNAPCECPLGTVCNESGECVPECRSDADCVAPVCAPDEECCSTRVSCAQGRCAVQPLTEAMCGAPPDVADGWEDPPGRGAFFVMNQIAIADAPRANVDGVCDEGGCLDNALSGLAPVVNDQVRQLLLGGETLLAVEIAGLEPDYAGFDRSVTVKVYAVRDADDPFFPANNFRIPPGHTECCQFLVDPRSLVTVGGLPQARSRLPAQIRDGRLFTVDGATPIDLVIAVGEPPHMPVEIALPQMQAFLPSDRSQLRDVLISGAFTARSLSETCNPYCRVQSPRCPAALFDEQSTLLELVTHFGGVPDIDVDADGIECVYDTDGDGLFETCCPADGAAACSATPCAQPLSPIDPSIPASCAQRLEDGFSVSFDAHGLPAELVGIAP